MATSLAPGLRFSSPDEPGCTRKMQGRGKRSHWAYYDVEGRRITDESVIARMNRLAVPPAYVDVWYCTDETGHIQAVGYDARGRRQYRYHPDFRSSQEHSKFASLAEFGEGLPALRRAVERDLSGPPLARETVLAAVVRLLDVTAIRIGNEAYARDNKSFGATTLRRRHVKAKRGVVEIEFRGKSGKVHQLRMTDKKFLRVVRRCQDLPGQALFRFRGEDGGLHAVGSADVNLYIRNAMAADFTAKHFRTWSATVLALEHIASKGGAVDRPSIKSVADYVAEHLGNTPAIARKSYIHPAMIDLVQRLDKSGDKTVNVPRLRATRWLSAHERAALSILGRDAPEILCQRPDPTRPVLQKEAKAA